MGDDTEVLSTGVFAAVAVALYVGHQLGDYWVQTHHQAGAKSRPGPVGQAACIYHVATYTLTQIICVAVMAAVTGLHLSPVGYGFGFAVSAVTHYIADRRWPLEVLCTMIGQGKLAFYRLGQPRPGRDDNPTLGTGAHHLDQVWHLFWGVFVAGLLLTAL